MIKNSFTAKYTKELKMLKVSYGLVYSSYYIAFDRGIQVDLFTTHKNKKMADEHPLTCEQRFTYNSMIKHSLLAIGLFREMKTIVEICKINFNPRQELLWNSD